MPCFSGARFLAQAAAATSALPPPVSQLSTGARALARPPGGVSRRVKSALTPQRARSLFGAPRVRCIRRTLCNCKPPCAELRCGRCSPRCSQLRSSTPVAQRPTRRRSAFQQRAARTLRRGGLCLGAPPPCATRAPATSSWRPAPSTGSRRKSTTSLGCSPAARRAARRPSPDSPMRRNVALRRPRSAPSRCATSCAAWSSGGPRPTGSPGRYSSMPATCVVAAPTLCFFRHN